MSKIARGWQPRISCAEHESLLVGVGTGVPDSQTDYIGMAVAAGAREPHNMIEVRYGLPSGHHYYGSHDYVPR